MELYAGDKVWQEWFDRCCVSRCAEDSATALTAEIRSAMFAQLARTGYSADIVESDDPVAFFDAYFMMKGTRDTNKPLKSYYQYRMKVEGCGLKEFVCGTLFSSRFGRIHDIVRDWIASVKGWKPHALKGEDGRRHIRWESAAEKADVREYVGGFIPQLGNRLDRGILRGYVREMLSEISLKIKVEKSAVAFLLYATAHGLAISSPEVLAALKVKKSRAHKIKETVMKEVKRYFSDKEVEPTDPMFAQILVAVCEEEKEARHE